MGIISPTVIGDPEADDDADDDDAGDDDDDDDDDDEELPVASPDALEQALSPMAATAATASIGRYLFMAFLRCSAWVQRRERGPYTSVIWVGPIPATSRGGWSPQPVAVLSFQTRVAVPPKNSSRS
jgi:hypothetical protein